jgi:hypothetical protein
VKISTVHVRRYMEREEFCAYNGDLIRMWTNHDICKTKTNIADSQIIGDVASLSTVHNYMGGVSAARRVSLFGTLCRWCVAV